MGIVFVMIFVLGVGGDLGFVWVEGMLWVGYYCECKICQIDLDIGKVLCIIEFNWFVMGVIWVDGEFWYVIWEGDMSELWYIDL